MGVGPLRSNHKWKKRKTFGTDGLDEEEQMVGRLGLEAVDGDSDVGDRVKRVRQTVIVALGIFTIGNGDDSTIE